MNSEEHQSLMVLVERIVRPIRADHATRMKMRHELLAHVEQIFVEESRLHSSTAATLARTVERFGSPDEIRENLQKSIPNWIQSIRWMDEMWKRRPGESFGWFAARAGLTMGGLQFAFMSAAVIFCSIALAKPLETYIPIFLALICIAFGANVFVITSCGLWVVQPFLEQPEDVGRNRRRLAIATLFVALMFLVTFMGLMLWSTSDPVILLRMALGSVAAAVVMFPIVCGLFIKERRESYLWDQLELQS